MKHLSPLDASWLYVESRKTPMHIASLDVFKLPADAPADFVQTMATHFRKSRKFATPWNLKLRGGRAMAKALPVWIEDKDIDMDYHFRHSALPRPGGERELGVLISRLHSHQLDLDRPPWEVHLIEGLERNRVALYIKVHHSMTDGVSGARMINRMLSPDPDARNMAPPWSIPPSRKGDKHDDETAAGMLSPLRAFADTLRDSGKSSVALVKALRRLVASRGDQDSPLKGPFSAPSSALNPRIKSGARRFATQKYELDHIKRLAKAANCTVNDLVVYLCATAIRRFLKQSNQLPERALTAGIPVSIRAADDEGAGNALSFIVASLATDIADPLERLEAITASTSEAKQLLQTMPKSVLTHYTNVVMAPYMLQLLTGFGAGGSPAFNTTISNVPGPKKPLYFNGAELEAIYPVSLIADGGALSITCVSYANTLSFGFTGCRDSLPHMQRIAVYTGEALDEISEMLLSDT